MRPYFEENEQVSLVSQNRPDLNGDTVVCSVVSPEGLYCPSCKMCYNSSAGQYSYELTIRATNHCGICKGDWLWQERALRKKPEGKVDFKTMVAGLTDKLVHVQEV
jgi:hypothetical protein